MLRICKHCQSPFRPHPKVPGQTYCSMAQCQKARRSKWQKQKLHSDDGYRQNQADAQRSWARRRPECWKDYRKGHPEYVERNKAMQRSRNRRSRTGRYRAVDDAGMVAKMDGLTGKNNLSSGYYLLYPIGVGQIAKMDEMLVRIEVITVA